MSKIELYNADCLEKLKDIADNSIDLILTDPPYGINFISNRRKEKYNKIKNDNNLFFLDNLFIQLYRISKNNTSHYCFCSFHNVDLFKQSIEKYFKVKNILIWEKNNTSMGDLKGDYAPKYEMIIFFTKGRKLLNNGRDSNILKFKRTGNKLHSTQKPVDLLEYLINKTSDENQTVLDCFMGSGSTGVACLNTNRNFIGIELDKDYFEIANKRIEDERTKNKI